jgi:hypothetical protein
MDISNLLGNLGPLVKRNSSTILTGIGVAGSVGSAILAVKATPGAVRKLDAAYLEKNRAKDSEELENLPVESLTKLEVIKIVWKDYIPAVGLQIVTITCVIGAQSINLRRQATLISVATLSETAFREYQDRVTLEAPTVDRKVRDEIAKDHIDKHPVSEREVLIIGNGDQLFYDDNTDRYFMSTMQKVQKAVNDINFRILNQNYASVNEFYNEIGLKRIADGDEMGWTPESPLEIDYVAHISDDERPAISIRFFRAPLHNMWKGFV